MAIHGLLCRVIHFESVIVRRKTGISRPAWGLDVLDLLQIKSFAKAKDFGTFRETFAKDPDIYYITLKFASS